MQRLKDFWERGAIAPIIVAPLLGASVILALGTIYGMVLTPPRVDSLVTMYLEPLRLTVTTEEQFTVRVMVSSPMPVNAFAGEILFDPDILSVQSIDYNTSIADLWAEKPWYENGAGTVNFIGGTTRRGGFMGTGELISLHFRAQKSGDGTLAIRNAQILQHDGLGTKAPMESPLDGLFTVTNPPSNLVNEATLGSTYRVVEKPPPSLDLNGDGKQSVADVSILLLNLGSDDLRFDLNQDGTINTKDLSILLSAR